ncbi:MAG: hypothetical protein A3D44_04390 [Candidatus Staskawiczbacteria bacterium RIFCSPHIGHO2_02_FULL_42_22]|uniref:Uncharacterized protein n=1 Tax=Candidatus Staskawiczbacteria bacterium RIFCSPHIGHO2_02_FULL_42_22 TaxID=1802207 RepID=A0A1G2I4R0_9BACT|nr:MAG: hypothetical protein A3D44_04390 [Candidatus Staskawiczbacteria bacterium RIFCSPHIGHO2_02_FULL_42_22]
MTNKVELGGSGEKPKFNPSKELKNIKDIEKIVDWFKEEFDRGTDELYMSGFEYLMESMVRYVAEMRGLDPMSIDVENHEDDSSNQLCFGHIDLMGHEVLRYTSPEHGQGIINSEWNDENLKKVLRDFEQDK